MCALSGNTAASHSAAADDADDDAGGSRGDWPDATAALNV